MDIIIRCCCLTGILCTSQELNAERLAAEAVEAARLKAIADAEAADEALRNAVSDLQNVKKQQQVC